MDVPLSIKTIAMPFCFHQLYRQLTGKFSCKNIPTTSALTNKIYTSKTPSVEPWGGSWVIT
jgi:hypothetical protein